MGLLFSLTLYGFYVMALGGLAAPFLAQELGLDDAAITRMAGWIGLGAFGGHEFRTKEVAILYVVLTVFSVFVFVKGLGLPIPTCPAFLDDACRRIGIGI